MKPLEQPEVHKQETHKRESMEIEHWRTVNHEVQRAFDFLVETVNFQQTRIANVLLTNSLILGFSGTIVVIFLQGQGPKIPSSLYVASLFFLALGLVAAAVALWPRIVPQSEDLFLKPRGILEQGRELSEVEEGTQQFLVKLSESIVSNADKTQHNEHVKFRRKCIYFQLTSILLGLFFLIC